MWGRWSHPEGLDLTCFFVFFLVLLSYSPYKQTLVFFLANESSLQNLQLKANSPALNRRAVR